MGEGKELADVEAGVGDGSLLPIDHRDNPPPAEQVVVDVDVPLAEGELAVLGCTASQGGESGGHLRLGGAAPRFGAPADRL